MLKNRWPKLPCRKRIGHDLPRQEAGAERPQREQPRRPRRRAAAAGRTPPTLISSRAWVTGGSGGMQAVVVRWRVAASLRRRVASCGAGAGGRNRTGTACGGGILSPAASTNFATPGRVGVRSRRPDYGTQCSTPLRQSPNEPHARPYPTDRRRRSATRRWCACSACRAPTTRSAATSSSASSKATTRPAR